MPRNRPNIGDTNWGTTLNNHLNQLSPNGGGINYGTTAQRPTLTNNDDGYTYFDTTTKQVIRWNGTQWEVIIVGLPSDDAITNLTNQINTLNNQITTLNNRPTGNTITTIVYHEYDGSSNYAWYPGGFGRYTGPTGRITNVSNFANPVYSPILLYPPNATPHAIRISDVIYQNSLIWIEALITVFDAESGGTWAAGPGSYYFPISVTVLPI